jgi:gluconate 2-dehydrogenase gamma chain
LEPAYKLSRRSFLQAALAIAAASSTVACGKAGCPWRFLSVDEAKTLAALCDQIIPADEDPGGAWAGVVQYIDRQLCGPLQHLRSSYRVGIAAVQKSCRILYGSDFTALAAVRQAEFLTLIEQGRTPAEAWRRIAPTEFFELLLDQTMQGYYGDPRHGGNREGASWKMLGIPYPPIRGRLHFDARKQ